MSAMLLELADRCEAATGPSEEIDTAIWYARAVQDGEALPIGERAAADFMWGRGGHAPYGFTASLDAALTLVPEGCGVEIRLTASNLKLLGIPQMGLARVFYVPKIDCVTAGATPALALCAAALRGRASLTQSKGDRDDQQ